MTLNERLAQFFTERPNVWIDGRELATIAGFYAFRTRKPPFSMTIPNRQRTVGTGDDAYVISEYKYIPADEPLIQEHESTTAELQAAFQKLCRNFPREKRNEDSCAKADPVTLPVSSRTAAENESQS